MDCNKYNDKSEDCRACINRPNALILLDELGQCADCEHGIIARYELQNKFTHIVGCKISRCPKVKKESELDNCINCLDSETLQFNSERVNYTAIRCKKCICFEQLNF